MVKPVTKRYGSAAKARAAVKGGGSNNALRRLKAEETVKVRFLQEPEDWHEAWYHYVDGKFSWCSQVRSCSGCSVGNRARKIVLANAVIMHSDRDGEAGKVVVMQMPTTLADQVLKRHERFGTVLDRDYDLSREGATQNDTKYSVDYDEKKRRDLSRWEDKIHDITAIVSSDISQNSSSDDSGEDEDDEEPRSTKKSSRRSSHEDEDYEDEDDEDAEDEFADLDRTELKREIKKLDPDYVVRKSQSDDDLREILRDLTDAEDSDDEEDEDDIDYELRKEEERRARSKASSKSKYDGLNEFKPKPAAKKAVAKKPAARVVRRSR